MKNINSEFSFTTTEGEIIPVDSATEVSVKEFPNVEKGKPSYYCATVNENVYPISKDTYNLLTDKVL